MNSHSDITLYIDLQALADNYKYMARAAHKSICGAVVKANAYGLGVDKVAPALYVAGCRNFFVATLDEALELNKIIAPDASIYVFHGIKRGEEELFEENGLIPVINDHYQLEAWIARAKGQGLTLPAILHFDTGMNRLGFNRQDAEKIAKNPDLKLLDIKYVMSHLVAAEDKELPVNKKQLEMMWQIKKSFPNTPMTLSNSWGVLAGENFHFDMVRPGCALYGVKAASNSEIKNVVTVKAKTIQLREVTEDGFAGYGATKAVKKGTKLAVCPLGYADGYLRSLSNNSHAYFKSYKLPLLGRVSMDLTIFDISAIPEGSFKVGDELELMNGDYNVNEVAENAGTIGYEILTDLGHRYKRVYKS